MLWLTPFLCHSERSEETRIFLGAKHFDFTEGMRSRAAPNSIFSYAKPSQRGKPVKNPSGGDKREGAGVENYFFNSLLAA
jgi:hypothetical protein